MRPILFKLLGTAGYFIYYSCIAHCTFEYVGELVLCSGPSMEPTIYSDDILFTEHITPHFRSIAREDIVIAKCPSNPKLYICKRVKGLPGDKIKTGFNSYHIVPKGHVWLEGDNSSNSSDSRAYGSIPQGLVKSRALFRVWPFKSLKLLSD